MANVRDERTVLHILNLDINLRLTPDLTAFATVPWGRLTFDIDQNLATLLPGTDENTKAKVDDPEHRHMEIAEVGDITIGGRYAVFPRDADRTWDVAVIAGVVFPTGKTRFDAHHFELDSGTTLQFGNGIFMPLVGVSLGKSFDRLDLRANAIAQLALYPDSKRCQYGKGGSECQDEIVLLRQEELCGRPCVLEDHHQPSSTLVLQVGATYAPEVLPRFGFGLGLDAVFRTPERRDGNKYDAVTGEKIPGDSTGLRPISNTGGVWVYVTPTLRAKLVDSLVLQMMVQVPIYRYINAQPDLTLKGGLVADFVFRAMLSYEFWSF